MIAFLTQPLFMLILAVLQFTLLEFFSIGSITIDAAFVFVIYAGLYIGNMRGAFLILVLGFFLDCIASPIFGLQMFLYILFFYISILSSTKINRENKLLVAVFTGISLFVQGVLKAFFFWLILDVDIFYTIPTLFFPQAVVTGILSPLIYTIFNYSEVLLNAEVRQPDRRL
jgi:rod shape-determining protein MreD